MIKKTPRKSRVCVPTRRVLVLRTGCKSTCPAKGLGGPGLLRGGNFSRVRSQDLSDRAIREDLARGTLPPQGPRYYYYYCCCCYYYYY